MTLITFFDLLSNSILYSGIINFASAKKLIIKEYFFSKYWISLDNLFSMYNFTFSGMCAFMILTLFVKAKSSIFFIIFFFF